MTHFDYFLIDFQETFIEAMKNRKMGPIIILTFLVCIPQAQN